MSRVVLFGEWLYWVCCRSVSSLVMGMGGAGSEDRGHPLLFGRSFLVSKLLWKQKQRRMLETTRGHLSISPTVSFVPSHPTSTASHSAARHPCPLSPGLAPRSPRRAL